MKLTVKSALLFSLIISLFSSCASLEVMHYKSKDLDRVSKTIGNYVVYVHDKSHTYQLAQPSIVANGIKGQLTPITEAQTIAEIKDPKTKKLLKKHEHDLNIYTKLEIVYDPDKDFLLKNTDITSFSYIAPSAKPSIGEDIATGFILALGVAVIVGVVYSFQNLL